MGLLLGNLKILGKRDAESVSVLRLNTEPAVLQTETGGETPPEPAGRLPYPLEAASLKL